MKMSMQYQERVKLTYVRMSLAALQAEIETDLASADPELGRLILLIRGCRIDSVKQRGKTIRFSLRTP
jgi:uncharacterized protein YqeY